MATQDTFISKPIGTVTFTTIPSEGSQIYQGGGNWILYMLLWFWG